MIVPNKIKKPSISKRKRAIDFMLDSVFGYGYKLVDNQLIHAGGFCYQRQNSVTPSKPVHSYYLLDDVLVYCADGIIYKLNGNSWTPVSIQYQSKPFATEFTCGGEKRILTALGEKGQVLDGKQITFNQDIGIVSHVYDNRILTANKNVVYYSCNLESVADGVSVDLYQLIQMPAELGDVVAIGSIGNVIYVVGKHGICALKDCFTGNDFTCEQLRLPYLSVVEESVQIIGDAIYLISERKLYKITSNGVKAFDVLANCSERVICPPAGTCDYLYICPTFKKGEYTNVALIFDTLKESYYFDYCMEGMSSKKGYCVDPMGFALFKFEYERLSEGEYVVWSSKRIDLGTNKLKRISRIGFQVSGDCLLRVRGIFGRANFKVDQATNDLRCNLISDWFEFEIESNSNSLPMRNLEIDYTVMGE